MSVDQVLVLVPTVIRVDGQFYKSDAALDQSSGHQTLGAIEPGIFIGGVQAVKLLGGFRFIGKVGYVRYFHLHPESQFVILNGRFDSLCEGHPGLEIAVDLVQVFELYPLGGLILLLNGSIEQDRLFGEKNGRRMIGGKKTVAECLHASGGYLTAVNDHITGQVLTERSQSVGYPGPHTGSAGELMSAMQGIVGIGMIG